MPRKLTIRLLGIDSICQRTWETLLVVNSYTKIDIGLLVAFYSEIKTWGEPYWRTQGIKLI